MRIEQYIQDVHHAVFAITIGTQFVFAVLPGRLTGAGLLTRPRQERIVWVGIAHGPARRSIRVDWDAVRILLLLHLCLDR